MFNRGGRQARPPLYPSDPMNPRILSLLAACILTIGPAAAPAEERPVRLHTLNEMNTAAAPLNSHAGAERLRLRGLVHRRRRRHCSYCRYRLRRKHNPVRPVD